LYLKRAGMSHFLLKPGSRADVRVGGDQRREPPDHVRLLPCWCAGAARRQLAPGTILVEEALAGRADVALYARVFPAIRAPSRTARWLVSTSNTSSRPRGGA
jgi:hypothetical protein